ncbi:unnamed protein product [Zymoseptoria tritici ST99CH_3D7]|uniref:Uncharacterized protein n=1 Tax=Zymoseptoria tritici (strain ST99CH_3D7) TaxID=1276538 RepID=A0A1X7S345_ZYMT9|nr:unnamed protein product [Zymoseptoria tritici ST99CH_3D7]
MELQRQLFEQDGTPPTTTLSQSLFKLLILMRNLVLVLLGVFVTLIIGLTVHELDRWHCAHPRHRARGCFYPGMFVLVVLAFGGVVFAGPGWNEVATVVLIGIWFGFGLRKLFS